LYVADTRLVTLRVVRHKPTVAADAQFEPVAQANACRNRRASVSAFSGRLAEEHANLHLQEADIDNVGAVGHVGPVGLERRHCLGRIRVGRRARRLRPERPRREQQQHTNTESRAERIRAETATATGDTATDSRHSRASHVL